MKQNIKHSMFNNKGQAMLLTVLILSGAILGASPISGYLMLLKIRGSSDISNSAKAIFAADSGIEWELYKYFKNPDCSQVASTFSFCSQYDLSNGAKFTITGDPENNKIKVIGESANTFRAFELE